MLLFQREALANENLQCDLVRVVGVCTNAQSRTPMRLGSNIFTVIVTSKIDIILCPQRGSQDNLYSLHDTVTVVAPLSTQQKRIDAEKKIEKAYLTFNKAKS